MESDHKELQLLPTPHNTASSSRASGWPSDSPSMKFRSSSDHINNSTFEGPPSLDLQLSISLRPLIRAAPHDQDCVLQQARPIGVGSTDMNMNNNNNNNKSSDPGCIDALKWQAAEQIRIAGMEKAYAERVREMTRREMELAQSEFTRARHMWERAREEVEKAEKLKERATRRIDSRCMEITCQACRQKFRPAAS